MPVKIGSKYYLFARGGCKTNIDVFVKELFDAGEKLKSPHVKAHDRGAALRLFTEAMEVKGAENANLSCKEK